MFFYHNIFQISVPDLYVFGGALVGSIEPDGELGFGFFLFCFVFVCFINTKKNPKNRTHC